MSYKATTLCKERELRKKAEQERDEAREKLAHLRACVFDVLHCVKTGAFEELEKAWKK
jgi:hypothetical protein